jgi:hypothetical protein
MKRGDKVYKVVPSFMMGRPWFVQERTLVVCSDKQVRLDSFFCRGSNLIFQPIAIGREFHETPDAAVRAYITSRERNVASARTALSHAEVQYQEALAFGSAWIQSGMPTPTDDDPSPITKDML